ncbi:hypothetical protein [Zymobacter sp. IVIA_12111.31 C1]|uniref:hypothetical protein n=1 Tax=Zymobacter sp. IVIA_12111.31 C1 TaxID=3394854 RepID=UPI0039C408A7
MDKILALLLSVVPTSHAQTVQNDAHSYVKSVAVGEVVGCDKNALQASLMGAGLYTNGEGRYVLDVARINDDYSYTLKDKKNNKETRFSVESEIQSNVDKNLAGFSNKIKKAQDEASFNEAIETIKSLN